MPGTRTRCRTTKPACVLVVDDEAQVRATLVRWIQQAGYECQSASGVDEACRILSQGPVDVITSDINLPGETGDRWLPRLRRAYPKLPIIMLTGCDDARVAIRTLHEGAWGYLIKPVAKQDLLKHIQRALEHREVVAAEREYVRELEALVRHQGERLNILYEELVTRLTTAASVYGGEDTLQAQRIGLICALVAQAMHWPSEDVEAIRSAAPLQDIGRLGIPEAILQKPDELSPGEHEIMKSHALIGAEILTSSSMPVLQMAEQIARSHHERWDGLGYPDGLAGESIPPAARIVAVVNAFANLTQARRNRPALADLTALNIVEQAAGTEFDPKVVQALRLAQPQIRRELNELVIDAPVALAPLPLPALSTQPWEAALTSAVG